MSRVARNRRRARGESFARRRRILLLAICVGCAVLLTSFGLYRLLATASSNERSSIVIPEPPAIDPAGADPAVVQLVSAARTAVSRSPRSAAAWGRLGMVLFVHSWPNEAAVCFTVAEQLDRRDAHWPYYQALLLAESDPEAAIPRFLRAADLCADSPDVPRLRLGELLLAQGRLGEAKEQFQRVLQRDPANGRARLGLGRLAFLKGDFQESLKQLAPSLADSRTQKASRILLAQTRERSGQKLSPQEYGVTAAMADDPDWPDPFLDEAVQLQTGKQSLLIRANVLLEKGRFQEATALTRQLLRDSPDSDMAWLILGKALIQQKDLRGAQEALHRVLRLVPDSVEAHFHLGYASYLQRDYHAAATWYRKATELKPDFAFAYHDLGHCLVLLGDPAGAIVAFRTALSCQPDMADAHRMLSELLLKEGKPAEAFAHARLALQFNPADAAAQKLVQRLLGQIAIPVGP